MLYIVKKVVKGCFSTNDPQGIEWGINFSTTESIILTNLSASILKLEKTINMTVTSAYQQNDSTYYPPTNFSLVFRDEDKNDVGVDDSGNLNFILTRNINRTTGVRVLAQNPFGSSSVHLRASYSDSQVYSSTTVTALLFGGVGTYTNLFDANITSWGIGTIVDENYTVVRESTFKDYETWVISLNSVPIGYSEYFEEHEYEKTSGLQIGSESVLNYPDEFHDEYSSKLVKIDGVIPADKTDNSSSPSTNATPGLTLSILLMSCVFLFILNIRKKQKTLGS